MPRHDGRTDTDLRPLTWIPDVQKHPLGSVMIQVGDTHVLCAATVEEKVPPFLVGAGEGWVTAEYAMLPSATDSRFRRESSKGRPSGRTMEIQRLIGRAMRSVVDRKALGERTIWIDCDVIQADGGTRTASITGGIVAMCMALGKLKQRGELSAPVLSSMVGAVSVGLVEGRPVLDLDYVEDSAAEVDLNAVRTERGDWIEIQGTAEGDPFPQATLDRLTELAGDGIAQLIRAQRELLGARLDGVVR